MASLKFLIDSMCANFTVESMYDLVKARFGQEPFTVGEMAREIRCSDRSLDFGSAKMLAEAALQAMAERGEVTVESGYVYPAA